jgi:hypothetical protein
VAAEHDVSAVTADSTPARASSDEVEFIARNSFDR